MLNVPAGLQPASAGAGICGRPAYPTEATRRARWRRRPGPPAWPDAGGMTRSSYGLTKRFGGSPPSRPDLTSSGGRPVPRPERGRQDHHAADAARPRRAGLWQRDDRGRRTPTCRAAAPVGAVLDASASIPAGPRAHLRIRRCRPRPTRRAIEYVLDVVGLADAAAAGSAVSLGMRQRLGLATALLADPELLILDERPTGSTRRGSAGCAACCAASRPKGGTVLVSSHLLAEVGQTVDSVVILDRGRLVAQARWPSCRRRRRPGKRLLPPHQGVCVMTTLTVRDPHPCAVHHVSLSAAHPDRVAEADEYPTQRPAAGRLAAAEPGEPVAGHRGRPGAGTSRRPGPARQLRRAGRQSPRRRLEPAS